MGKNYTLGADVYSGFVTLEDGSTIFIEYNLQTRIQYMVYQILRISLKI